MPELPEVETIARDLNKRIKGLNICDAVIYDDRVVHSSSKKDLAFRLKGKGISKVYRRAKMIIIQLSQGYLLVHLKMTGQLIYGKNLRLSESLKDTKVVLNLSDSQCLNFNDQRTFGKLQWVPDLNKSSFLNSVGPEPLEKAFNPPWLKEAVKTRKAPIKTLLMNQHFLAGIGNIYASEILFDAGINPKKQARKLTEKQISALHGSTVKILNEAIKHRGVSMRNYRDSSGKKGFFMERIKVYGRDQEPCPSCRQPVKRIVQAGRSTFFCCVCQK